MVGWKKDFKCYKLEAIQKNMLNNAREPSCIDLKKENWERSGGKYLHVIQKKHVCVSIEGF